jgi:hypothetical protein
VVVCSGSSTVWYDSFSTCHQTVILAKIWTGTIWNYTKKQLKCSGRLWIKMSKQREQTKPETNFLFLSQLVSVPQSFWNLPVAIRIH